MKMNRGSGFALLLIACGALILLSKLGHGFGIHNLFGWMMGFIVPAAMIGFGYIGLKNGKSLLGWILIVLGGVMLLGKLSGLIGLIIAIGLIGYGISMLKRRNAN